jgi:hypothetical protein
LGCAHRALRLATLGRAAAVNAVELIWELTQMNFLTIRVDLTAALMNAPRANLEAESKFAQYCSSAELAKLTEDGTVNSWLNGMNEMFKSFDRVPGMVVVLQFYMGARCVAAK